MFRLSPLLRRTVSALVIALSLCAVSVQAQTVKKTPAKPKQSQATVRVTLLQLNDVYQISPVDKGKNAGLARVATLRKKILAESPNTLFLLGGDTISPSVASTIFKGEQVIATWNAIGLDYSVR